MKSTDRTAALELTFVALPDRREGLKGALRDVGGQPADDAAEYARELTERVSEAFPD